VDAGSQNITTVPFLVGLSKADRKKLSTKGYCISSNRMSDVAIDSALDSEQAQNAPADFYRVFNGIDAGGLITCNDDSKRLQAPLRSRGPVRTEAISVARTDFAMHRPKELRMMVSLEGCELQPMHTDFNPDDRVVGATPSFVMVIALQCTTIVIHEYSHLIYDDPRQRAPVLTLTLQRGGVLYMNELLAHGGGASVIKNVRLHQYLEAQGAVRETNTVAPLNLLPTAQQAQLLCEPEVTRCEETAADQQGGPSTDPRGRVRSGQRVGQANCRWHHRVQDQVGRLNDHHLGT
jgi:hypothetical protein